MRILEEGFWPQYSLEDVTWLDGGVSKLAWPMVSFCDIPISRLREHIDSYGSYGIGLCREQWQATGLNPVLYVSPNSILRDLLRELLLDAIKNPDRRIETAAMVVLALCKPLDRWTELNGQRMKQDFYSECEWRFLPWVEGVKGGKYGFLMKEETFCDPRALEEANQERRNDRMLEIGPSDVRYLVVKSPDDVSALVNFIDTKTAPYSRVDRDMLKTRIMVLDDVLSDF